MKPLESDSRQDRCNGRNLVPEGALTLAIDARRESPALLDHDGLPVLVGPQTADRDTHDFRHTHITTLLRARVPVHIVAKRVGHKNVTMTLDRYSHAIPDDDATASDVYAALLAKQVAR